MTRCNASSSLDLSYIHASIGHPGVTRFWHYIRSKNLPFSLENVKSICKNCPICCEIKPRFHLPVKTSLIKSTQPWERISIDLRSPIQSKSRPKYLFVVIDEFSRFPFAYPCIDMSTSTVIKCLSNHFSLFGTPATVHSDRSTQFMSGEFKTFLMQNNICQTRTSPYHPMGNGQVERLNGTLWPTITLNLKNKSLSENY